MRRSKGQSSIFEVIPILVLIFLSVFVLLALLFSPQIIAYVRSLNITVPGEMPPLPNITGIPGTGNKAAPQAGPAMPKDMLLYYSLKNKSCETLSKDFLIATHDESHGSASGLSGNEAEAASLMLEDFESVSDTRTYVRGDMMKKVISTPSGNHTTIWKDGRIYQCNPNCTMKLLGEAGWQAYLDSLSEMRSGCAHFGRTAIPASVNLTRLLWIENTGKVEKNGFRCENFMVSGNRTYALALLNSSLQLDSNQRALIWSLAHQYAPVEECLDDGVGTVVYRSVPIDLTKSYRFEFAPGGYMHVKAETTLTYFSDNVPESFLALPK